MTTFNGTSGDDTFTGTSDSDTFDMTSGGNDTVSGNGGNDFFYFGGGLTSADRIDGGAGIDTVFLAGGYFTTSGNAIQLGSPVFTSIEELFLMSGAGNHYDINASDSAVAAGQVFLIESNFNQGVLNFDGSGEHDGAFQLRMDSFESDRLSFTGSSGNDILLFATMINSTATVAGGGGDDFVSFGGNFGNNVVHFDGGGGFDTLFITDALPQAYFSVDFSNVELLVLPEELFQLTIADTAVAAGKTLKVDATAMTLGSQNPNYVSYFDGSAENDGHLAFVAGTGHETLDGGAQSDTFDLTRSGFTTARGNGGNDTFSAGSGFSGAMHLDGGDGNDTLSLSGDYGTGIDLDNVTNIETLKLGALSDYNITVDDMTVAAKVTFHVLASGMLAGDSLVFDGSAELNGRFDIQAGAGDDSLTGGKRADVIDGGAGNDSIDGGIGDDILKGGAGDNVITGGRGADTIDVSAGFHDRLVFRDSDSRPSAPDVVDGFDPGRDKLDLHLIDADTTQARNQAFHLGGSAFTHSAGELIQYQDAHNHTVIAGDVNGDGTADIQILLISTPTLTDVDIIR